jgi:hypothetical protein
MAVAILGKEVAKSYPIVPYKTFFGAKPNESGFILEDCIYIQRFGFKLSQ